MTPFVKLLRGARDLIRQIKSSPDLAIECPHCSSAIPASQADLFTEDDLSPRARTYTAEREAEIVDLKAEIDDLKNQKEERVARTTQAVNIGKIIENFAPVLRGFGYDPRDCRGVFAPIDYIVFHGAHRGQITRLEIVEVKSGQARLTPVERTIRNIIVNGEVDFQVMETGE